MICLSANKWHRNRAALGGCRRVGQDDIPQPRHAHSTRPKGAIFVIGARTISTHTHTHTHQDIRSNISGGWYLRGKGARTGREIGNSGGDWHMISTLLTTQPSPRSISVVAPRMTIPRTCTNTHTHRQIPCTTLFLCFAGQRSSTTDRFYLHPTLWLIVGVAKLYPFGNV